HFADFYHLNADLVFGILMRMTSCRAEAEELMQEVFLRVWTRAGTYDQALSSPRTWLTALTRHTAIDRLRAQKVRPATQQLDLELPSGGPCPENVAIMSDYNEKLALCMGQIDPEKAEFIRRAYIEGWSYEELAVHAGVPVNTMKTWLRRSLLKLRGCMSHYLEPP
ncbi:MAG: sigma-70 family RNA polymerase sigma factor, partial [Paracoccus sp. (in: a-proteobacteria)]